MSLFRVSLINTHTQKIVTASDQAVNMITFHFIVVRLSCNQDYTWGLQEEIMQIFLESPGKG